MSAQEQKTNQNGPENDIPGTMFDGGVAGWGLTCVPASGAGVFELVVLT